jgi:prepilin-type N-terminal cleavage/methylation domain-containing protein
MRCSRPARPNFMNRRTASTPTHPSRHALHGDTSLRCVHPCLTPTRGLTLIEVLITLAVISILAALLIPQIGQEVPDQLTAVAEIVAADLEYARSLAVVNGSKYQITFEPAQNRYILRHSGSNTLLHVLPTSPFRQTTDAPDQQTTDLDELPITQPRVSLYAIVNGTGSLTAVSDIEFTPLGGTTRSAQTEVWLECGSGSARRFVPIQVNAATGLTEIGPLSKSAPAAVNALVPNKVPAKIE